MALSILDDEVISNSEYEPFKEAHLALRQAVSEFAHNLDAAEVKVLQMENGESLRGKLYQGLERKDGFVREVAQGMFCPPEGAGCKLPNVREFRADLLESLRIIGVINSAISTAIERVKL